MTGRHIAARLIRDWNESQPSLSEIAFAVLGGLAGFAVCLFLILWKGY